MRDSDGNTCGKWSWDSGNAEKPRKLARRFAYTRNPDGKINNCAIANGDEAQNCQVCKGECPDRF